MANEKQLNDLRRELESVRGDLVAEIAKTTWLRAENAKLLASSPASRSAPANCDHEFKDTDRVVKWKGDDGSFGGGWRNVEDNFCRDCGKQRPL